MPKRPQQEHVEDLIDESGEESFPASDPPAVHPAEHGRVPPAARNPKQPADDESR